MIAEDLKKSTDILDSKFNSSRIMKRKNRDRDRSKSRSRSRSEKKNLQMTAEREKMVIQTMKKLLESATNAETIIPRRSQIGNASKDNASYGITQWPINPKKLGQTRFNNVERIEVGHCRKRSFCYFLQPYETRASNKGQTLYKSKQG